MFPKFRRILFATDLTANASHALGYVAELAATTGAEVHILHVVEELSEDAKITLMMFLQDEHLRDRALHDRRTRAKASLAERQDDYWSRVEASQQKVRERFTRQDVVEGFAPAEILKRADSGDYDLVVLGAHEHGMNHSFLGNTAKRVLRRARIPTLIVPQKSGD